MQRPKMELAFLGGATTVTGSQLLLDIGEARVLVDCGLIPHFVASGFGG